MQGRVPVRRAHLRPPAPQPWGTWPHNPPAGPSACLPHGLAAGLDCCQPGSVPPCPAAPISAACGMHQHVVVAIGRRGWQKRKRMGWANAWDASLGGEGCSQSLKPGGTAPLPLGSSPTSPVPTSLKQYMQRPGNAHLSNTSMTALPLRSSPNSAMAISAWWRADDAASCAQRCAVLPRQLIKLGGRQARHMLQSIRPQECANTVNQGINSAAAIESDVRRGVVQRSVDNAPSQCLEHAWARMYTRQEYFHNSLQDKRIWKKP